MKKAFALWQKYGNIRFSETSEEKADIMVKFGKACHNDPYCFDGKDGTLAHAFYPYPGHGIYIEAFLIPLFLMDGDPLTGAWLLRSREGVPTRLVGLPPFK